MGLVVRYADGPELLGALAELLTRYVSEQGWASETHHIAEIESLPGEYAPPQGRALVAVEEVSVGGTDRAVGCVVMRPLAGRCPECVEMRRLYVIPEARHRGAARALVCEGETWARTAGYERLRLVTLPHMTGAMRLYSTLGFEIVGPYRASTAADAIFMEKLLCT